MPSDNPEFITCAMTAIEEGIAADDIKEECACRMGLSGTETTTTTTKE